MNGAARRLAAFVAYAAVSVAFTWPLVPHLAVGVSAERSGAGSGSARGPGGYL